MIFNMTNNELKTTTDYLKKENKALKKKISWLENERDRAVAEKDRMRELLDKYQEEYESLIADARKLVEKQKDSEKAIDKIVASCENELERMMAENV